MRWSPVSSGSHHHHELKATSLLEQKKDQTALQPHIVVAWVCSLSLNRHLVQHVMQKPDRSLCTLSCLGLLWQPEQSTTARSPGLVWGQKHIESTLQPKVSLPPLSKGPKAKICKAMCLMDQIQLFITDSHRSTFSYLILGRLKITTSQKYA